MLHSSQFYLVSFSLVLYIEVAFLMSFLEIVVDNFGFRCSLEDKKIMCVALRKVVLDSLKAGGPFPITLMFRIRFFTFLSMCYQLFQSQPQKMLIDINLCQTFIQVFSIAVFPYCFLDYRMVFL